MKQLLKNVIYPEENKHFYSAFIEISKWIFDNNISLKHPTTFHKAYFATIENDYYYKIRAFLYIFS